MSSLSCRGPNQHATHFSSRQGPVTFMLPSSFQPNYAYLMWFESGTLRTFLESKLREIQEETLVLRTRSRFTQSLSINVIIAHDQLS